MTQGRTEEPPITCFQEFGDCMQRCSRLPEQDRMFLCGMDCELALVQCIKRVLGESQTSSSEAAALARSWLVGGPGMAFRFQSFLSRPAMESRPADREGEHD
jgi:hypothetical protein